MKRFLFASVTVSMAMLFHPALLSAQYQQEGAAEPLPTMEQLQQQLSAGQHQDVLRQVARLLALRGEQGQAYDRYDLLMLRGEAALRGKANAMAIEAFSQAARTTENPQKQAIARATEVLIRRSKPVGYVPRGAPAETPEGKPSRLPRARANQPIPYLEPADRKEAFAALLNDELAAIEPKIKSATGATGLAPIIDAIKSLGDVRAIEIAASGDSERTKAISGELGAHAHRLIAQAMQPMEGRIEQCWRSASRQKVRTDGRGTIQEKLYGLWGLTSTEANDLKAIIATCEKIQPVASELAAVTDRAELIATAQEAKRLHARASEVLNYDYNNEGRYNRNPNQPAGAR